MEMDRLEGITSRMLPYPQGSPEWFKLRSTMLTASDIGSVVGLNPYCTRIELLKFKAGLEKRVCDPIFTRHGHKYEDVAAEAYSRATGRTCYTVGLVVHPFYPWLGASPDRITACNRAVEIKCPLRRRFEDGQPIPGHYWAQMQLQMEVLDLDVCDFVQYRAGTGELRIDEVARDRVWWRGVLKGVVQFYAKYLDVRADHELQCWEDDTAQCAQSCLVPIESGCTLSCGVQGTLK